MKYCERIIGFTDFISEMCRNTAIRTVLSKHVEWVADWDAKHETTITPVPEKPEPTEKPKTWVEGAMSRIKACEEAGNTNCNGKAFRSYRPYKADFVETSDATRFVSGLWRVTKKTTGGFSAETYAVRYDDHGIEPAVTLAVECGIRGRRTMRVKFLHTGLRGLLGVEKMTVQSAKTFLLVSDKGSFRIDPVDRRIHDGRTTISVGLSDKQLAVLRSANRLQIQVKPEGALIPKFPAPKNIFIAELSASGSSRALTQLISTCSS